MNIPSSQTDPSPAGQPVAVERRGNRFFVSKGRPICQLQTANITSLALDKAWADAIREGYVAGISDGSFKEAHGAAAWTLIGPGLSLTESDAVPGHASDQSAYRSELFGILKMIQRIHATCLAFDVTKGKVELACDGESAWYRVFSPTYVPSPDVKHYDLLSSAKLLIRECPIQ